MANNGRFEYTIGFKTDKSGLKKAKEELEKIQQLTINSSELKIDLKPGEAEIYAANIQNAKDSALQLYNALQNATKANGQFSATSFIGQLKTLNLKEIYNDMSKVGPIGTQAFRSIADQALKLNTYVKQGNALLTKFGNTLYRNLEWLVSGNLINSVTGVFTKAYGFTKNLDSSLNNIRIVTGKSADEMERFGREAQKTALELSQGTTDITNASLIFYQQGLDQEEVNARTEVTAKMANVTGQSAETIADQMTAVWNGFKAGSEELEHYADVMTAIAASTASSSAELAGSISKVASVANLTGVDMEQLSAMLSTVISVTRDSPETVGTAFKTIFARINDLVEDGTDEFGVSLGRISSHLAAMGIHILDEEGKLRDLGDTLTEVGEKWQTYSKEQQVAIAEQIGGKRQWTQVTALFDNWDKYSSALNIAKNATGALQEQQDIYSESVAAHLQQLKTQWEGIYQELLNSKEIIAVVNVGKNLLSVLETIVKTAGGVVPILGSVASIMLGAFSDKVAQQIIRIKNNLILMAEAASDAALKTKVAEEFSRAISEDDTAMRAQIAYYKAAGQMTATMTKEERERINALGELSAKKETEIEELIKEKAVLDEVAKKWGNIKEYQDTSSLNLEELKEKIQQVKKEAQEAAQAFENWRTNEDFTVETLTGSQTPDLIMSSSKSKTYAPESGRVAFKPSGSAGITKEEQQALAEANSAAEKYQQALGNLKEKQDQYNEAVQNGKTDLGGYLQQLAGAQDEYRLATEELQKASQGLEQFDNLTEKSKQNLQSINSINLSGSFDGFDQINEKFQELQTQGLLSEKSIEEISAKLKTMDRTSTDELADAWKLLNQKLKESEKDFSRLSNGALNQTVEKLKQARTELIKQSQQKIQLLDEAQFSKATQGLTQMASAVGQLGFGLQSLSNAWKTLNNDEATGLEKFTAMTMAIGQLSSGVKTALTGLDKFASAVLLDGKAIATVVAEENRNLIASEANQMAKKAEEEQSKRNAVAATEEAVSKKANTAETNAETLSEELNTGAKAAEETTRKLNVWTIDEETGAIVTKNEVSLVERTGNALTLASIKTMIAARLAHIATLIKEIALMAAAHWPILILIAALGALAFGISKVIKANKEAEEAHKRAQETFDKHTESVKSLANAYNELEKKSAQLLQSFKEYHNIYDAFQEGKVSVEDYTSTLDDLIEKLDLTEEEAKELADLLRKAKITGDYLEVNDFIEEKEKDTEENLKTSRSGKYTTLKSSTAIDIVKQENKMDSDVLNSVQASGSFSADEHRERIVGKASRWAGEGLKDAISEEGIDFSKVTAENLEDIENLLTEEKQQELQDLIDNSKGAEKAYYLQLYDAIYTGRMEAINQAAADSETFSNALDSNLLKFDSSTSEAVIQKNMQKYVDQVKENIKKANPTLSDEEIDELAWKQTVNDALLISPDAEESITNIELFSEQTSQALTKAYGKYASAWLDEGKKVYAGVLFDEEEFANEMSQENMAKVNDQLKNVGLNLNQLGDFSDLSEDSIQNLMNSIMSGAPLSADAIEQISDEVNEADQAIAFAKLDFDDLSQKGEEWYTKLKENKVSPSDLVDNKGYNELLDQVEALGEAFDSEELNEAIDIISHPDAHDVDELANAWKVTNKYIAEGDLKAPVLELDEALKDLKKNDVYKDGRHLVMTAELDVDEAEKKLDKFLDADRSIEVTIDAKMDEASEQLKTDISDSADLASKIGEGFTTSLDDLDELSAAFPGILDGMTMLSDGSIQLSQNAVAAAAETAKQEMDNEIDKQILKYKIQNDLLQYKKDKYNEALVAAAKMQETEYTNEEDLDKDITGLMDIMNEIEEADRAATLVAEDQLTDNMLTKWEEYYTNAALMNESFTSTMIANMNKDADDTAEMWDVEKVKSKFITKELVSYTVDSDKGLVSQYETKVDNAAVHDYAQRVQDSIKERLAEIDKQMADNLNQIKILEMYKQSNATTWENVGKVTDATQDNTDATEDNAKAQQELLDLLNEEIDAYHDVTQQIERHTTALNRLQKAQEKATGKTLIKNLQDQMKAYQDLNNDYADKQLLQYEEAAVYRVQLEEQGVTFDENGVISNYSDILNQKQKEINADLSWYNSLSAEDQEAQKDWIESRQAEYDSLVDLIGNYDQLWNQDIPDLADEIAENIDKQVELELEIKKQIVQIEVDKGSLKRMEMELNKTLDNVQEKDLERNLAYNIQSYFTYSDEEKAKLKRYLEAKQKKDEADTSGEDLSAADLENYREALEDYNSIMQEKAKQANEIISSAFDGLNEKIERQKTQFETMSKLFEHDMNLIKLRYGDQAFEQLKTLYAAREENAKAQLSNANLALEVAQKELAAAQAKGDLDLVQAAQDKVTSALEAQRQAVIDNINAIQDTATNAVDAIFAHLDEQVAGVSFEKMKKQWDDMEKDSADYYDAINGAYEIEKLRTNMKKAINESGSAATQKALNNLMNEEITKLQQKDKLSKYDIERANALFDIEQKRAAFREAQNNKSKMRLRRDVSGNYSYQFVSDEDKVTSAMQDLADAQNQLYNIDKEAYKNNLEKMQEYYLEYQEEMKAAANASAEERQAIEDRYMERIAELQEENGDISRNLIQDVVNDSEILTGKSIENIEDMTQAEVDALMGSIIPAWESYLGVMSRSKDLLADMKQAGLDASQVFDTSKAKIDIEMALNGLSWDSLIEGFDPAIENIKTMTSSTDEIAQEVKNISAGVSQFIEAIKSNSFTEELEKLVMALENGTLITPANIGSAINILPQRNAYISSDNIDTTVDSITNLIDRIITSYTQLKGEEARIRRDQLIDNGVIFDADGIINNYAEIIKQKQLGLSADLAWYSSSSGEDQEIQKDWIESRQVEYDNLMDLISGYDQLWDRDIPTLTNEITKIAEEKTSNDLQGRISDLIDNSMFVSETVQFLADRLSKVYSQQSEILSETMDYLHTLSAAKEKERELQEYQPTVVNINADFPAVTSQYEIEQALDSLVARATQRAYRTIR